MEWLKILADLAILTMYMDCGMRLILRNVYGNDKVDSWNGYTVITIIVWDLFEDLAQ